MAALMKEKVMSRFFASKPPPRTDIVGEIRDAHIKDTNKRLVNVYSNKKNTTRNNTIDYTGTTLGD